MSDTLERLDLDAIARRAGGAPRRYGTEPHSAEVIEGLCADIHALLAEAERLRGEARAQQDDAWRPIESAPRTRHPMFVVRAFSGNGYSSDPWCVWRESDGGFARWPHDFPPTHWMPLPAAPREQSGEEKGDG